VLLCFINPILGNCYSPEVSSCQQTSDDNLGSPHPHPPPKLPHWLYRSPSFPLRTDPQLLCWQPGACALAAALSGQVQSSFGLNGESPKLSNGKISWILWSQGLCNPPPPKTEHSNTSEEKRKHEGETPAILTSLDLSGSIRSTVYHF